MRFEPGINPSTQLRHVCGRDDLPGPHPFDPASDLVTAQPEIFLEVWQHMVDGLAEQIALLDESWRVLVVNQSWTRAANLYGHSALCPGTDYVQFCRGLAADGLAVAQEIVAGLEEIMRGKQSSFRIIEPEPGHDFQLSINRFEVGDRKFVSVTRYDITRLLELRKLREDFSHSVITGQAEERRRMGREIHDSTTQLLVALGLMIGHLRRTGETESNRPILDEMQQLLAEAQREIRSISYLAHPPLLGKLSLPEALQALIEGFSRRTGMEVTLEMTGGPQVPSLVADGALYRVVQEALSNMHRHSHAKHASVHLSQGRSMTHVVIADDGVGMPDVIRAGVGLSGMHSRLAELGGRLSIIARSPGTAVIGSVPVKRTVTVGEARISPIHALPDVAA